VLTDGKYDLVAQLAEDNASTFPAVPSLRIRPVGVFPPDDGKNG